MNTPEVRTVMNRILVRREKHDEKTQGGIYFPENAKEIMQIGTVVVAGPGLPTEKGRSPMSVKVGDKIIFAKHTGVEREIQGEVLVFMRDDDVLGVIEG